MRLFMNEQWILYLLLCVATTLVLRKVAIRLRLSKAKHKSMRGHSKWSRRIAGWIKFFDYSPQQYFNIDDAPLDIVNQRIKAFDELTSKAKTQSSKTLEQYKQISNDISDVQFTSMYRVPFPFRTHLPEVFKLGSMINESQGVKVKDLDDNWRYDLSGSYGVNVFGYEFYKSCIKQGSEKVEALGPALGSYHPLIADNVSKIKAISQLDEVSFHMSGTEAVMQAVRMARYHTKRTHLVRLCGAYHGWWDGVQPGIGNRRQTNDVYTLADLSEQTLKVLSTRNDIACVLINPLQAFHPNADSASDASLIASDRATHFDKAAYTTWLKRIRKICTDRNIVLIFDEVFTGFRLSYRGAQGYFGIQADMVTYGKTLGGGLPVGVLAGKHELMKRFKDSHPVDVSLARGTFNSHPYVLGAMNVFLERIAQPEIQKLYTSIEQTWQQRTSNFNQRLSEADLPIKVSNMHSILSISYTQPSAYNWMLQFYLRANGLELSWLGTGRFIMSFDYTDADFDQVIELFIQAAEQMQSDGWWWISPELTNQSIKQKFLKSMLNASFPRLNNLFGKKAVGVTTPIHNQTTDSDKVY
jgi:glutamate-1-semialdehyde 2,1-aminomutase